MRVEMDMLAEKISQSGLTGEAIARQLKVDQSTYYRKLAKKGATFTIGQAQQLAIILGLSHSEAAAIFFAD